MEENRFTPPTHWEPPRARTIRARARAALRRNWWRMTLVFLVLSLLTGFQANISFNTTRDMLQYAPNDMPINATARVRIGPFQRSYQIGTDLTEGEFSALPYWESTAFAWRSGWAAIPGGMKIAFFAAFALALVLRLMQPALELGKFEAIDALYRGERPRPKMLLARFRYFGRALWLGVLMAFFGVLWTLLLVVPGIIAAYRYSMAYYILWKNPDMRAIDALRESKRLMDGHKGRLFCLDMSYIGWYLLRELASFALQLALLFAATWYAAQNLQTLLLLSWIAVIWTFVGNLFLNPYLAVGHFEFFRDLEAAEHAESY